jgi:hypothetical protein
MNYGYREQLLFNYMQENRKTAKKVAINWEF